ncbi:hypothetical protein OJJOAM_004879 [Cupriavidus sp. H18C1]
MRQPPVASLRCVVVRSSSALPSADTTASICAAGSSFLNAGPSKSTSSEKLVSSLLRVSPCPRRVCVTHDNGGMRSRSFCHSSRYSRSNGCLGLGGLSGTQ